MLPAQEKIDATIFNVEKNGALAKQIFHAYYRTPDASGAIYRTFPDFFLIKPAVLDDSLLAFNKQELPRIENCKNLALARAGYLGITKYYDEKFASHWIKIATYPCTLDELNVDQQDGFFYLLNEFVQFTQKNPTVYGDLTADAGSDENVALMLHSIAQNAQLFVKKLQHYPVQMLLSFDAAWPTSQVKNLLASLAVNEQSWQPLFLEHLRSVMRKNKGLAKTHPLSRFAGAELTSDAHPSNTADSLAMPAIPSPTVEDNDCLDMMATLRMTAFTASPLSAPVVSMHKNTELVPPTRILGHWWQAAALVNTIKLLSLAALLLASALSGFLFSQSQQSRLLPTASVGQVTQAANLPVISTPAVPSEEYVVLENLRMSEDLTLVEPSKNP
ncbi:MAG: hypothetical protein WBL62_05190 [Gallionella sp.]